MPDMRKIKAAILLLATTAAVGACGDNSDARDATISGERWCQGLRDEGILWQPMSKCIAEFAAEVFGEDESSPDEAPGTLRDLSDHPY